MHTVRYTHEVKVGDPIFLFDQNRRIYPKDAKGKPVPHSSPIWREHWVPRVIVGETARTWLVGMKVGQTQTKAYGGRSIAKQASSKVKELPAGMAWTEADIDTLQAAETIYWKVHSAIGRAPAEVLFEIAKLLGVKV